MKAHTALIVFFILPMFLTDVGHAKSKARTQSSKSKIKATRTIDSRTGVGIVPIVLPIFGSPLMDVSGFIEVDLGSEVSLIPKVIYKQRSCSDCSRPGKSRASGVGLSVRKYLDHVLETDTGLFADFGFNLLKAKGENNISKRTSEDGLTEGTLLLGVRPRYESFYYEFAGGIKYRSKGIEVDSYTAYQDGIRPLLHFALGVSF